MKTGHLLHTAPVADAPCNHDWECTSEMNDEGNYVTICTCKKCGEVHVEVITPYGDDDD